MPLFFGMHFQIILKLWGQMNINGSPAVPWTQHFTPYFWSAWTWILFPLVCHQIGLLKDTSNTWLLRYFSQSDCVLLRDWRQSGVAVWDCQVSERERESAETSKETGWPSPCPVRHNGWLQSAHCHQMWIATSQNDRRPSDFSIAI